MTLGERIKLIDDMIRENPDVTIKDYWDLSGEIIQIVAAEEAMKDIKEDYKTTRRRSENKINPKYLNRYRIHF